MTQPLSLPPLDTARVNDVLSRYREPVLIEMRAALDRADIEHFKLMRYHLSWEDESGAPMAEAGGKMLRPALCLLFSEAVGGDVVRALPGAAALELVHNFTLIHDDIEDDSDTRHGRPALWRVAGLAQAINAGDGMFVVAQRTLARMGERGVPAERVLAASRSLNDACIELCEGQHVDIGFERRGRVSPEEYQRMIAGKTAALLGASAEIGAIAGGADDATCGAVRACGLLLGMAFQVQDDVLGTWGEAAVTGKPVGEDIRVRKKTFPVVWAYAHLDDARRARLDAIYAEPVLEDAHVEEVLALLDAAGARQAASEAAARWAGEGIAALAGLSLDPERRRDVEALASFFVHRSA